MFYFFCLKEKQQHENATRGDWKLKKKTTQSQSRLEVWTHKTKSKSSVEDDKKNSLKSCLCVWDVPDSSPRLQKKIFEVFIKATWLQFPSLKTMFALFPPPCSRTRRVRRLFSGRRSDGWIRVQISGPEFSLWFRWEVVVVVVCVIVAVVFVVGVKKILLKEGSSEAVFLRVDRHLVRHQVGGPFDEIGKPVNKMTSAPLITGLTWINNPVKSEHQFFRSSLVGTFLGTEVWTPSSRGWTLDWCSVSSAPPGHGGFLPPPASGTPPRSTGDVALAFGENQEFSWITDWERSGMFFFSVTVSK